MSFAHPWMLLGLAAALIPFLVHLFDRRRPRPQLFAPLDFVLRSQRRTASRLRLRRLILYALRTLLLLAFPVALARPEWSRTTTARVERGPAATAVVLDASLSMRYRDGESLFDRGRIEARAALGALQANEPATWLLCGLTSSPRRAPSLDRQSLLAEIDAATPSYTAANMSRCLEQAAHALEDSPLAGKRLVVISDFTARSFASDTALPTVRGPDGRPIRPEVVLRDVAAGKSVLPNHAVVGLQIEPAPHADPRTFQLTFSVRNFSPEPLHDLTAQLQVGDAVVARGFVDIPAGGRIEKVFTHRFDRTGPVQGQLTLTPDALAEDDRQAFVLQVPSELKTLIVNGAPSPVRHRDEAFFVEAALRAPGSPVTVAVRDAEAAWREDFSQYGLLLLLNVEAPPPEVGTRLARFVEQGGGLLIAMGDRVQADAYNARLGALLPRNLRVVKSASHTGEPEASARLGEVAERHPLFALFTGSAQEGLFSARFSRYFLLEPQGGVGASGAQVLATFDDGAPALVETRLGKGRVALWTSTLDRDWSDLPIRTSFLPLIQRLCAQLGGALEERDPIRASVGERTELPVSGGPAPSRVLTPSGTELPLSRQADGAWWTPPLPEPGVYRVLDTGGAPVPGLQFAATLDPGESDLTRVPPESLSRVWGQEVVVASSQRQGATPVPLWTWILLVAAAALLGEGLILRRH